MSAQLPLALQLREGGGDLTLGGGGQHAGAIDDRAGEARDVEGTQQQRQHGQREDAAETTQAQNSTAGASSTRSVSTSSRDHCAIFS